MGWFDKLREPVFLKESSDAYRQLQVLRQLASQLTIEGQELLFQDIRALEYGIQGERQIAYELKNSHMPMYILHDICLEDEGLCAQIDYIAVTRKICFIIECKNLYGDIEIDSRGDFYRIMEIGGQKKKEAIYSPVTQNEHHLELLKTIRLKRQPPLFWGMAERRFERSVRSVVVLANPKTVLYSRESPQEIREHVIRADQLVAYLRRQCQISAEPERSDKKIRAQAKAILLLHQEKEKNYLWKYQPYWIGEKGKAADNEQHGYVNRGADYVNRSRYVQGKRTDDRGEKNITGRRTERSDQEELLKALRVYRWNKSQEEGIKPYLVYNDKQMADLMEKMPQNAQELLQVSGFSEVKVKKYGRELMAILREFCGKC